MDENKMIHETIVRDVIDLVNNTKDFDDIEWLRRKRSGSIAKSASKLILTFPVIVSNSLSIQTAMIISKAIERKCTSLLQILFSSAQLTHIDNLQDFIGQFHNNLDLRGREISLDNFMDVMDAMYDEGALVIGKEQYDAIKEDMKNLNYTLSTGLNPISINDYKTSVNAYGESAIFLEAPTKYHSDNIGDVGADANIQGNDTFYNNQSSGAINMVGNSNYTSNVSYHGGAGVNGTGGTMKDYTEYYNKQILPSDIKKANELMPTNVVVTFTTVDNGVKHTSTGVIGVKAKLYPVSQLELINRISSKVKDRNGLFNLVRATTREISFFRDLAFAIDKAKLDAVYVAKDSDNARMFKLLERRAAKNRYMRLIKSNNASPITSLVLSQEDVNYLKTNSNIDMMKTHTTRTLLESYNLMDIIIADESLELARFMFDDGDGTYETLTFDALEKEASDNSYKKVINLMSKVV